MTVDSLGSLVGQTRDELKQVREWLLRPSAETMSACVPSLERAHACLQVVSRLVRPGPQSPALNAALTELAREVREVSALLHAAGRLYFGAIGRVSRSASTDPGQDQPAGPVSALG